MKKQTNKPTRGKVAAIRRGLSTNSLALARGIPPRALGEEGTRRALLWTLRWGFASPGLIDYLTLDPGRRGKAARLVERGFLEEHEYKSGFPDTPRKVLTITEKGIEEFYRLCPDSKIEHEKKAIRWNQLRHDYIVQCIVADQYLNKNAKYISGPELAEKYQSGKLPDAILNGVSIELELTPKKPRELDQFVITVEELYEKCIITGLEIYTPVKAIANRYIEILKVGRAVDKWKRNSDRLWYKSGAAYIKKLPPYTIFLIKNTTPNFLHRTKDFPNGIILTEHYHMERAQKKEISQEAAHKEVVKKMYDR